MAGKVPVRKGLRSTKAVAPDARGRAISQAHHVDSVVYNVAHADRHLQEAEKHAAKLEPSAKRQPAVKAELQRLAATKRKVQSKELKGTSRKNRDRDSG